MTRQEWCQVSMQFTTQYNGTVHNRLQRTTTKNVQRKTIRCCNKWYYVVVSMQYEQYELINNSTSYNRTVQL